MASGSLSDLGDPFEWAMPSANPNEQIYGRTGTLPAPVSPTPTTPAPTVWPTIAPNIQHSPMPSPTIPYLNLNPGASMSGQFQVPGSETIDPSATTNVQPGPGVTALPTSVPATPAAPSLAAYQNPFTQNVIDSAIRQIDDATKKRRNQLGTEAFGAGAFGDARHGIESAQLTEDAIRAIGELTGSLNQQGYESAMDWLNTDLDRQTSSAFQNAMLDQNWLDSQINLVNTGTNLDQTRLSNAMSLADALMGLDQYDRGTTQADLDVAYQDWLDETFWGDNRLNQFLSIISGIPGQTGSATSTPNTSGWNDFAASLSNIRTSDGRRLFG